MKENEGVMLNILARKQDGQIHTGSQTKDFDSDIVFILHQKGIPGRDFLKFGGFFTMLGERKARERIKGNDCI